MLLQTSLKRPRHRPLALWAVLGSLVLFDGVPVFAAESMDQAQIESERRACLVCHRMETIAYRDPETAEIRDLHIDLDRYTRSNHADLACTRCHEKDYRRYPHAHGSADEALRCVGCHEDHPKYEPYRFKEVQAQFDRSVHVRENPDGTETPKERKKLTCFACHDPHVFEATQRGDDIFRIVRQHNRVCMSCHAALHDPATAGHVWLPNREAHWTAVRCLDCHTPISDHPSHEILPAGQGVRGCDDCHSKASTLLNQLYAYRSEQSVAQKGLISTAVFNQAYVVGMSRSPVIDWLALGLIGLTLAGLTAHGVGRYRAYRKYGSNRSQA